MGGIASMHISANSLHDDKTVDRRGKRQLTAKPAPKKRANQPQQQIEVWYGLRQYPTHTPHAHTNPHPTSQTLPTITMHYIRAGPHSQVYVLARHAAVDHTSNDDGWDGEAEANLAHEGGRGAECGRGNERTSVVIYYDRYCHVECYGNGLGEEEGFLKVCGVLELRLEGEEGDVAG